jgi:hypothetical protein
MQVPEGWTAHLSTRCPCNPDLPVLIRMKCGAKSYQPRPAGKFAWEKREGHGGTITHWMPA